MPLALYFLVAASLGMGLSNFVYMSWADAGMALSPTVITVLNALYIFGTTAGMGCLYVFTWLTFRRGEAWARKLVGVVAVVMVAGYAGIAISGDFELSVVPGFAYWITWAARTSVFLWLLIESFRYWNLLRRRLLLGLADPLVANRFLLWGIWSSVMLLTGMIDPATRIYYMLEVGTEAQWVPEMAGSATVTLVTVSSGLLILAVITLYLTFFPTKRFRRRPGSSRMASTERRTDPFADGCGARVALAAAAQILRCGRGSAGRRGRSAGRRSRPARSGCCRIRRRTGGCDPSPWRRTTLRSGRRWSGSSSADRPAACIRGDLL